ncbi:MAG: HAD family phosphatase [Bacteroidetes bacterium]|nr:HAD family phosphatase [Bacteroidota bacterium]
MQKIKNLLFDLGGVILDIDFKKTKTAFEALGIEDFDAFFTQHHASPLFENLETGKIGPDEFLQAFRDETKLSASDHAIRDAWNAMIGEFSSQRIEFVQKLSLKYRTYLLSNTNIIHYDAFIKKYTSTFHADFNTLFIRAFYSHEIKLRKPYPEAFLYVLKKENLCPSETLFLDDTKINTDTAQALGIPTIHLVPPKTILDLDL